MNPKNSILFLLTTIISMGIFSCNKPDNIIAGCTASTAGDTVLLNLNKPVPIFTACIPDLQANVISINDSRCPKGVHIYAIGQDFYRFMGLYGSLKYCLTLKMSLRGLVGITYHYFLYLHKSFGRQLNTVVETHP